MEGVELKEEWQDEDFPMWAMLLNENKFKTKLHSFFIEMSLTTGVPNPQATDHYRSVAC